MSGGTTTVLCVPGPWSDGSVLRAALVEHEVLYAGEMMMVRGDDRAIAVDFCRSDDRMRRAFEAAGAYSTLSATDYGAIGRHQSVCYLVDEHGGAEAAAVSAARFALVLLRAGGYGVKVESAGKAHAPADWEGYFGSGEPSPVDVVDAYVTWVGDPDAGHYSCGMHNLGMADCATDGAMSLQDAGHLLRTFCLYQASEHPIVLPGQTFATAEGEPLYQLTLEASRFPPGNLFHNEFGSWRLARANTG